MTPRQPDMSTIIALGKHYDRERSLRRLARSLGYGPEYATILSTVIRMKRGALSRARENELRSKLNLPPLEDHNHAH